MTNHNPLNRLSTLSAHRKARTASLHDAVFSLLEALEISGARLGDTSATVDGYTLSYVEARSNVGGKDCWAFGRGDDDDYRYGCSDLALPVGHDGYHLHGDFNCPLTGPSREHLLAFAQRASRFVDALIDKVQRDVSSLDAAIEAVKSSAPAEAVQ